MKKGKKKKAKAEKEAVSPLYKGMYGKFDETLCKTKILSCYEKVSL